MSQDTDRCRVCQGSRPPPRRRAAAIVLVCATLLGCGGGDSTAPGPPPVLTVLGGNDQIALVGQDLPEPIRVRATEGGVPQAGERVQGTLIYVPLRTQTAPVVESSTGTDGMTLLQMRARSDTGTFEVRVQWLRCRSGLKGCGSWFVAAETAVPGRVVDP